MKHRILGIVLIVCGIGLGVLFWGGKDFMPFSLEQLSFDKETLSETVLPQAVSKIAEVKEKEVVAPPPLRAQAQQEQSSSTLTKSGILLWTNTHRIANNLLPLQQSSRLDQAAQLKLQDMFQNQYFAHVSPAGKDAGDFAQSVGYEFITIGENLALGNYKDDKTLVQAWMDSPGHRANILGSKYTEIGIAVGKGLYEGSTRWMAVQMFSLPLSACPAQPAPSLLSQIEANKDQLEFYTVELERRRSDLDQSDSHSRPKYAEKVKEYNAMVDQYNALAQETRTLVAEYNQKVEAFNACIQGG